MKGYVFNNQVRAERCANCKSTTEVLAANHNNPNLLLYGCKDSKCKHRLLRLDFDAVNSNQALLAGIAKPMAPKEINFEIVEAQIPS